MNFLKGKKILFLSPAFFGYEKKIVCKMQDLGAFVDYFDERSITVPMLKAVWRYLPRLFIWQNDRYYRKVLSLCAGKDYDYIFVVRCDMISERVLNEMKIAFPKAKRYLYLWDAFKNIPYIEKKIKYFDRCYSFDINDVKNHPDFIFRPLFYCDEYNLNINTHEEPPGEDAYDLCFIGTIHSDRYAFLRKVEQQMAVAGKRVYSYKYLQAKFVYYFFKMTKKEFRGTHRADFEFEKISPTSIAKIVSQSKAVLDIQHPCQSGLTIRSFEIMGLKKKLVTTNATIRQYDFFNEHNIQVIDRYHPEIDLQFMETPYVGIDADIYNRYSLESWLRDILV